MISEHSAHSIHPTASWLLHLALVMYIFVVDNFDALAQVSNIRIERKQVVYLCWMQIEPRVSDTNSLADWMPAKKHILSNSLVNDPYYSLNIILWISTPLLYQPIEIQTTFTTTYLVAVLSLNFTRLHLGRRLGSRALVTSVQQLMKSLPFLSPICVTLTLITGFLNISIVTAHPVLRNSTRGRKCYRCFCIQIRIISMVDHRKVDAKYTTWCDVTNSSLFPRMYVTK